MEFGNGESDESLEIKCESLGLVKIEKLGYVKEVGVYKSSGTPELIILKGRSTTKVLVH